jgi:hypothetical protein
MKIKKHIVVDWVPPSCLFCDFCIAGTRLDILAGSYWLCTAGKVGVLGKETLTNDIIESRPSWCPLELEPEKEDEDV